MRIKIVIEYSEELNDVRKIVNRFGSGYIDFHCEDKLSAIPSEWIKSIEILDDED